MKAIEQVSNPCLSLEQAIRVKRLTDEIATRNNSEKRKRINAIEEHQERRTQVQK